MHNNKPELISIHHDDYHAQHIGTTSDGSQFFLTTPFEPNKCEYIALFKFDGLGNLIDSNIELLGERGSFTDEFASKKYNDMLQSLGDIEFGNIKVKPFSVNFNNTEIGLITRVPEDEDDAWAVQLLPGNFMAFFEPWDSGEYDT